MKDGFFKKLLKRKDMGEEVHGTGTPRTEAPFSPAPDVHPPEHDAPAEEQLLSDTAHAGEGDTGARRNWLMELAAEQDGASEEADEAPSYPADPAPVAEAASLAEMPASEETVPEQPIPEAVAGPHEVAHEDAALLEEKETDPLDRLLQDEVVTSLLQRGAVTAEQALVALQSHDAGGESLWRRLATVPGVEVDVVLAEAARLHGFEPASIDKQKPNLEFVEAALQLLAPDMVQWLYALALLPYEYVLDPEEKQHGLVLATDDPMRTEVGAFVRALGLQVELRYAPGLAVAERLAQAKTYIAAREQEKLEVEARLQVSEEQEGNEVDYHAQTGAEQERSLDQARQQLSPEVDTEPEAAERSAHGNGNEREVALEQGGLSADALARAVSTDVLPEEDVMLEERFDEARPDMITGDGYGAGPDDDAVVQGGGAGDLPDEMPVPEVANWTESPAELLAELAESSERAESSEFAEPVESFESADTAEDAAQPEQEEAVQEEPPAQEPPKPKPEPISAQELEAIKRKDRVVAMLLRKEAVTAQQVTEAQRLQKEERSKEALWRFLAQVNGVEREAVFAEAARVYAFRAARLGNGKPDPDFVRTVMDMFSEEHRDKLLKLRVLPYESELDPQSGSIKLIFVTHDPTRPEVHRLLQLLRLERFELCYVPEPVVLAIIAEVFPRKNEYLERLSDDSRAFDLGTSYEQKAGLIDEDALEAEISRSSLINLFEATLVEAVRQGASDIHIWPNAKKKIEIHFRVDGRLARWHLEDKVHPEAFLAVIKDNAINVDRFERDAAQDGFIQRWIDEALIRFRVSVLPIANAAADVRSESIVIRVLDDRKVITDLKKLGLLEKALERFDRAIRQPHGMVILTGPTGSGKSTTLVAALHQVVTPEVNVLTVEDPVEYIIPGVRQIKLNHKLGLEEALRAILRHDPDVVMVGEMRDRQTAELAIKLSNTGHLTFSTLHTNDAPSAVSRLYKMGIEPFLIAYAINLVVAQRLIRRLCPECKVEEADPDPVMLKQMGFSEHEIATLTFYVTARDPKCPSCKGVGYKGRRAISEAMYFSRAIRHIIAESKGHLDEGAIRDQAVKEGMLTLRDSAREYVKRGETSVLEMLRVTTTEE
jgi:type IV pilus assembly protein PilB